MHMTHPIEETQDQLDKALNEMDGVVSDQMIYRIDSDTFRFKDVEYKLIENHREAFDIEMMEHRFTDYLLKYDYIVGDIAYEKLRLRGFYDDGRKGVPIDMKISNLEDYLIEYCNFGCRYFVFERVEKKKADPESYFKRTKRPKRGRKNNQRNNPKEQKGGKPARSQQNNRTNHQGQAGNSSNKKNVKKDFEVVKKQEETTQKPQRKKQMKTAPEKKGQAPKKQFEIRKKKD